jgi:hypothetical protein
MGLVDVPFDIPNFRCENGEAAAHTRMAHTRIGWFARSTTSRTALQCSSFVAELAKATELDPKEMLLVFDRAASYRRPSQAERRTHGCFRLERSTGWALHPLGVAAEVP